MRIEYTIVGMDVLMREHLRRNIDFDNIDLVFCARQSLENLEHSRLLARMPVKTRMLVDSFKDRSSLMLNNIDGMFKTSMTVRESGEVVLELFVSPSYFVVGDSMEASYGRLGKRLVRFITRQGLIDGVEKSLRQVYKVGFTGRVLEDDGKKLRVGVS